MENNAILEMLIEQKELLKSVDKRLATQHSTQQTTAPSPPAAQPITKHHKFTVEIVSKSTFFLFIGMMMLISILGASLYLAKQPNYDQRDNDLKYRYIKMKGSATPKQIAELEDLFELSRDNAKIRQMHTDVERYEEIIRKQVIANEQALLKQLEVARLTEEAEKFNKR